MALHNKRGKEGEQLALTHLEERGYKIVCCNWRYKHYETDIIALKEGVLHFIEVKTRHSHTFGYPEESVSKKKFINLKKSAEFFLYRYPQWQRIQFDILSVTRYPQHSPATFFLIEDVYL